MPGDDGWSELAALHREQARSLIRLAALLVDDVGTAEEIVQDAFVLVHRRWEHVEKPEQYLRKSVVNLSRSRLRRRLVALRHPPAHVPHAPAADELADGQRGSAGRVAFTAPPAARGARPALLVRTLGGGDRDGARHLDRLGQVAHASRHRRARTEARPVTVEQRLRDATNAYADRIEPSVDGWQRLTERFEPRGRRPWRALMAGFATVLVLIVALYVVVDANRGPHPPAGRAPFPHRIVALTDGGQLIVLSSPDGDYVRELAPATRKLVHGGVVARARWAYFLAPTGRAASECGPGGPVSGRVMRAPIRGGAARRVLDVEVRGFDVSPDGRSVAIATGTGCDARMSIATYDIATGSRTGAWEAASVPYGTPGAVQDLAWSPDGDRLLFVWEIGSTYPYSLDIRTATSLNDAHRILIGDGSRITGYLGSGDRLFGLRFTVTGLRQVWEFDAETGAPTRRLFCCGDPVASDTGGTSILAFDDSGRLERWSEGDRTPTPIAERIATAVWAPRGTS